MKPGWTSESIEGDVILRNVLPGDRIQPSR